MPRFGATVKDSGRMSRMGGESGPLSHHLGRLTSVPEATMEDALPW